MQRILLIEHSATLRHAVGKRLRDHGYRVDQLGGYDQALKRLMHAGDGPNYSGIVVGWPTWTDPHADEFLSVLDDPEQRDQAVLILAHDSGATLREWVSTRAGTALLLWDDYTEAVPTLVKLLTPRVREEPGAPSPAVDEHPIRILFVDDSPSVRGFFRRLLQRHGYRTDTAAGVSEGMEKALHTKFDIAIIDYYMPEATGDVLCRKLREDARTRHIMSSIITSTYLEQVIRDCLDAGAVECMFKNEANELFLARIAAMERAIRFQQSIEAERRRLEGILSSVGEGVYGVDEAGRITFLNPAALKILGYPEDECLEGREPRALFHYADEHGTAIEAQTCTLTRAYGGHEEVTSWETVFWSRAAKPVPVECTVCPLTI
ncbi:MAG TPA: response regulator, partial [Chromatiales bacterium]|nr:response regulator [Chromatiales bacterium]